MKFTELKGLRNFLISSTHITTVCIWHPKLDIFCIAGWSTYIKFKFAKTMREILRAPIQTDNHSTETRYQTVGKVLTWVISYVVCSIQSANFKSINHVLIPFSAIVRIMNDIIQHFSRNVFKNISNLRDNPDRSLAYYSYMYVVPYCVIYISSIPNSHWEWFHRTVPSTTPVRKFLESVHAIRPKQIKACFWFADWSDLGLRTFWSIFYSISWNLDYISSKEWLCAGQKGKPALTV